MDPELIKQAVAVVAAAQKAGLSREQIEGVLEGANLPDELKSFSGINRAALATRQSGIPLTGVGGALNAAVANFANSFLGGLGDEIMGLLGGSEARENIRAAQERGREEFPAASTAGSIAGFVGGAGKVGTELVKRGIGATAPAAARAGRSAIGALGGRGATAQLIGGGAGRAAGAGVVGGSIGAAEGAVLGAAEGTTPEERKERAKAGALFGLPVGSLAGAGGTLIQSALASRRAVGEGGRRLASTLEKQAELPGKGPLLRGIEQARGKMRTAFQAAERAPVPEATSRQITDLIRNRPSLRRLLRQSKSTEARNLERNLRQLDEARDAATKALAEGTTPPVSTVRLRTPASIRLADSIKKQAEKQGTFVGRKKGVDQAFVDEVSAAASELEDVLSTIPGYRRGQQLAAEAGKAERAFDLGKKMSQTSVPGDDLTRILSGQTTRVSGKTVQPLRSLEETVAFRQGLMEDTLRRLRTRAGSVKGLVDQLETGDELATKLRAAIGDDARFEAFKRAVQAEKATLTVARFAELLIKFGGFVVGGSSLLGGALLSAF